MPKGSEVQVTLTNESAYILDGDKEAIEKLNKYWSFSAPGARFNPGNKLYVRTKGKRGWDGMVHLLKQGVVSAGVYRATRKDIEEELGIRFRTTCDLPDEIPYTLPDSNGSGKYAYQQEAVEAMCRSIKRGGGIVLSATGTGKTKEAADFFACVKCECLFVVHRITLLHQNQKEISRWLGEQVGIVGDSEFELARVTVATVQTLKRHLKKSAIKEWFRGVQIVFVDELHKQMAKGNLKLLETIKPVARYGLTATLEMGRKPVRYRAWSFAGPVIFEFPYDEGRKIGVLSGGRALQLRFPMLGDAEDEDEYNLAYPDEVAQNKTKLQACSHIVRYLVNAGRYVVVLAFRRAHVAAIRRLFYDIPYGLAQGGVSHERRDRAKRKFEQGDIQLLIASSVFEEGVDIKRVDAILDVAEFKSKNTALQKFGRGVRLHEDKQELLYIDFGTQDGRFRKAAASRVKALRAQKVPVKVKSVADSLEALEEVEAIERQGVLL